MNCVGVSKQHWKPKMLLIIANPTMIPFFYQGRIIQLDYSLSCAFSHLLSFTFQTSCVQMTPSSCVSCALANSTCTRLFACTRVTSNTGSKTRISSRSFTPRRRTSNSLCWTASRECSNKRTNMDAKSWCFSPPTGTTNDTAWLPFTAPCCWRWKS